MILVIHHVWRMVVVPWRLVMSVLHWITFGHGDEHLWSSYGVWFSCKKSFFSLCWQLLCSLSVTRYHHIPLLARILTEAGHDSPFYPPFRSSKHVWTAGHADHIPFRE